MSLPTSYGVTLSMRVWRAAAAAAAGGLHLLCLHGWLDNCASFSHFIPSLLPLLPPGSSIAALDFAGHGRSDHAPSGLYSTAENALHVVEALDLLGWGRAVLVGHSMGGGVAVVLAGSLPERVRGVLLLDSAGPPPAPAEAAPDGVAKYLAVRSAVARGVAARGGGGGGGGARYPSLESAVAARLATVATHPGRQSLSEEGAAALVRRAVQEAPGGGFDFCHDGRLKAFCFSYCEAQTHEFFRRIAAADIPVLLLRAASGWPYDRALVAARMALLGASFSLIELPGSHHFHLDPATSGAVVAECAKWVGKL